MKPRYLVSLAWVALGMLTRLTATEPPACGTKLAAYREISAYANGKYQRKFESSDLLT